MQYTDQHDFEQTGEQTFLVENNNDLIDFDLTSAVATIIRFLKLLFSYNYPVSVCVSIPSAVGPSLIKRWTRGL